ncbi:MULTISPECIES: RNA polymerase sigma factor [unclassified Butyrivibrio]|uniref:RNA polymerase sigma factor n=1 Tax=unclassified Butyrivibrio TaxID=2639466 RepID=UPI000479CF82|nr:MULTISPECIES: sigma-70 family RNA polymerase sigma factor [unclassified Butyrivibrio]MCR5342521.1 sigma-70 family RNA polymerase sigma factor [Butyrivibrio sp.]
MKKARREVEKIEANENLIRWMGEYKNLIFSICLRMTGDYFTAEDIAQETFLSAYMHMDKFDGNNEKAWLCRIAANKCTDYLRSAAAKSVPTAEDEMPTAAQSAYVAASEAANNPADIYETEDVMNTFTRCCEELPEAYSDIALQHFIRGRTAKEIAEEKGDNLKTIQTRIFRAKEMLKKTCRKEWLEA